MPTRSFNSTLDRVFILNRALDQAFATSRKSDRVWVPVLDVVERKNAYEVHAELPGVDPSRVEVSFEQNVLTLRGTKQSKIAAGKDGELRVHAAERVSGTFERSIRLPEFVDGEQITAKHENGLLTITVPKSKAAQARRIEIRAETTKPATGPTADAEG